jgi:hypothetical protein
MGAVGGAVGLLAGLVLAAFPFLGSWAVASDDATARTIGFGMMALGLVALAAAWGAGTRPGLARVAYFLTGVAGLLFASILWVPAAFFLLLGAFTRGYG